MIIRFVAIFFSVIHRTTAVAAGGSIRRRIMIATQLCPLYTYYRGCDAEVQKGEIEFLAHTTSTTNEIVGRKVS